jgi:hypothetical protein
MQNTGHIAILMNRLMMETVYIMRDHKMVGIAVGCSDIEGIKSDIYNVSGLNRYEWVEIIPIRYYPGKNSSEIIEIEKRLNTQNSDIIFDVY